MKTAEIIKTEQKFEYKKVEVPTQHTLMINTPDGRNLDLTDAIIELLNDNLAIQNALNTLTKG